MIAGNPEIMMVNYCTVNVLSSSHLSLGVVKSNGETESEETPDIDYISTLVNRTEDVNLSRALTQEEIAGKYWFET